MAHTTTYTDARNNLATLMDEVVENREIVRITRRNGGDVALIDAHELDSILETLHLVRSPKNARRLLAAVDDARLGKGDPQDIGALRAEMARGKAK